MIINPKLSTTPACCRLYGQNVQELRRFCAYRFFKMVAVHRLGFLKI